MMNRRAFLRTVSVSLLAAPRAIDAQQRPRVWKVGYIAINRPRDEQRPPGLSAFLKRLHELGYAEGRNLSLEERYSEGDIRRFPALSLALVGLGVDVILALGTPAAQAVQRESRIPIVMVGGRNPVEGGLAKSLARSGGTVTGLIQDVGHDLSLKNLQLLKEAVPRSARIAILTSSQSENLEAVRLMPAAARSLGVVVHTYMVDGQVDIESGFATMSRDRVDAMLALPSHPILTHKQLVVDLAARHRIPTIY